MVTVPADGGFVQAFRAITVLLSAAALLSAGSMVAALVLTEEQQTVPLLVWFRCALVTGISFTLFYFAWRARLGRPWAYRRLQLFSRIFPVVAVGLAAVPGLYPEWVVVEQLAFAGLLLAVSIVLNKAPLQEAFDHPVFSQPDPPSTTVGH